MLTFSKLFDLSLDSKGIAVMKNAMQSIRQERDSNKVGYYKLPTHSLSHLEELKTINAENTEQIIIIGIGGSSLGIKAINSILHPYTKDAKEMIFLENSDPITIFSNLEKIKKDKALFFVISKSGSTIETTSIFKTVISHCKLELNGLDKKRIITITDKGSALSAFAKYHKLKEFNIPDNVGGRFSVLSAVGIVPLSIAGYDTRSLLKGAEEMMEDFFAGNAKHILEKAYYLYKNSQKQSINVLFSYADHLEDLTKWYVQLWGESLGKINNEGKRVGLTPIGLTGAVDQHSFLQLIIEGPQNKNVTFISIEDFCSDLSIPNISLQGIEKTNFVNEQSYSKLINTQCDATLQSVTQSGVGADIIKMDKVSAINIGKLIVYFEILTSLVGSMLRVNTYDQPGVELGKTILYEKLS